MVESAVVLKLDSKVYKLSK